MSKQPVADGQVKLGAKTKVITAPTTADIQIKTDIKDRVNETKERLLRKVRTIREANLKEGTHISSHEAERLVALAKRKGRDVKISKVEGGIDDGVEKPRIRVKAVSKKIEPEKPAETPAQQSVEPKTEPMVAPTPKQRIQKAASSALTTTNNIAPTNPDADNHLSAAHFHHSQFLKYRGSARNSNYVQPSSIAMAAWGNLGKKMVARDRTNTSNLMNKHQRIRDDHLKQYLNKATPMQLQKFGKDHVKSMLNEGLEENHNVDIRFCQIGDDTVVYARFDDKWERFHTEKTEGRQLDQAKQDLVLKLSNMGYHASVGPDIESVKEAEELIAEPIEIETEQTEKLNESSDITYHEVTRESDPESAEYTINHAFGAKSSKTYQVHHKNQHIGYAVEHTRTISSKEYGMSSRPTWKHEDVTGVTYSPKNHPMEKVGSDSLEKLKPLIKNYHGNPPRWMQGKVAKLD